MTKPFPYAIITQHSGSAPYRGVEQLEARRAHNPEVVGSSPASATIKAPGIHYEYRGFSYFSGQFENAHGAILGHLGQKLKFWVTPSESPGGLFLCLFPEQDLGDALGSLGLVLLDDVGIDAL